MKAISLCLFIAMALSINVGPSAAKSIWDELSEAAPRSVFDDLRDTAPRNVFDDLKLTAPVAAPETGPADFVGE